MTGTFWQPFLWLGAFFGFAMMLVEQFSGSHPLVALGIGSVQGLLFGAVTGGINASSWVREWL